MAKFLALIILLASSIASAQDGVSTYQLMASNFTVAQCDKLLTVLEELPNPAIAILPYSFGTSVKCLSRIYALASNSDKEWVIQFHLSNEVGRRHRRLTSKEFLHRYSVTAYNKELEAMRLSTQLKIKTQILKIKLVTLPYSNIRFILSTGLENNFTHKASRNLYNYVKANWPHEVAVNPVINNNWRFDQTHLYERHGFNSVSSKHQGRCIINNDGRSPKFYKSKFDSSRQVTVRAAEQWAAKTKHQGCIRFLWAARWQDSKEQFKAPPHQRKFIFGSSDINYIRRIWDL